MSDPVLGTFDDLLKLKLRSANRCERLEGLSIIFFKTFIMRTVLSMQLPKNQFKDTHLTSNVKSLFAGMSGSFLDP
jgi:hypothetical protein